MKTLLHVVGLVFFSFCYSSPANSGNDEESWQIDRLLNPTQSDLEREMRGSVFIYSGLKDKTADRALDEHFGRIQSMMFVRTVITDDSAIPLMDEETGMAIVEEDGCSD